MKMDVEDPGSSIGVCAIAQGYLSQRLHSARVLEGVVLIHENNPAHVLSMRHSQHKPASNFDAVLLCSQSVLSTS